MGHAVDQAKQELELSRKRLEDDLGELEGVVRRELDWRARLRREGPRIAAIAGAVVGVAVAGFVLKKVAGNRLPLWPKRTKKFEDDPHTAKDLAKEIRLLREELDKRHEPFWQKLALKLAEQVGDAGGSLMAQQVAERMPAGVGHEGAARDGGGSGHTAAR